MQKNIFRKVGWGQFTRFIWDHKCNVSVNHITQTSCVYRPKIWTAPGNKHCELRPLRFVILPITRLCPLRIRFQALNKTAPLLLHKPYFLFPMEASSHPAIRFTWQYWSTLHHHHTLCNLRSRLSLSTQPSAFICTERTGDTNPSARGVLSVVMDVRHFQCLPHSTDTSYQLHRHKKRKDSAHTQLWKKDIHSALDYEASSRVNPMAMIFCTNDISMDSTIGSVLGRTTWTRTTRSL